MGEEKARQFNKVTQPALRHNSHRPAKDRGYGFSLAAQKTISDVTTCHSFPTDHRQCSTELTDRFGLSQSIQCSKTTLELIY